MPKITIKELDSFNTNDIGKRISDGGGLYGVVKPRADRVSILFRWRYRFNGKLKDFTCGTYPTETITNIRKSRDEAKQLVANGIDPQERKAIDRLQKKADQAEDRAEQISRINQLAKLEARITVNELFNQWEQLHLANRKDKGKEIRRMFEKDILPSIGAIAVADIKKSHVSNVVDQILSRGVSRMAKMILALMRQMFRFAQDRDFIEVDPTASIRKAKIGKPDIERDRILSEDEVRQLALQLPSANLTIPTESAIWIALATGCRIGELLKTRWEHVDIKNRKWLITSEISKNSDELLVHLSEFAAKHFQVLASVNGGSAWCYPNRDESNHVCEKTVTKQIGDRQRLADNRMSNRSKTVTALLLSGGKWTPHDLRRTAGTMMTALGVLPDIADKCLNHKEQNRIRRTYLRHNYEKEKQEAWALLGNHLGILTNRDNHVHQS